MLKITPVFETAEKERLCNLCGADSDPDALTHKIQSDGKEIGVCQFKLIPSGGRLLLLRNIDSSDSDALVITGRAALDFIERHSGNDAYYDDKTTPNTASALGFRNGKLNLKGYFDGSCSACCGGCEKIKIKQR